MTVQNSPQTFKPLRMDGQGRVLLPAELRQALHLQAGEELIPRVRDGQLILERRSEIRARLRGVFAQVSDPVGELLAERRAEAERE